MLGWNLCRFAESLLPLLDEDQNEAINIAQEAISDYDEIYYNNWISIMRSKLGIFNKEELDKAIIEDLLSMMEKYNEDYTNTFVSLTTKNNMDKGMFISDEFKNWYNNWQERLRRQPNSNEEVNKLIDNSNGLRKQRVGRFEDREQHAFHVERAAPVDPSVGYGAGEGRVVPARKGCIGSRRVVIEYGNHVVVGTEQDRRQGRVLAGPAEYKPVFVDRQSIQLTVNRGICLRQIGFEGLERIVVRPVDRIAYGRNPDSAGQPFDGLGGRFDAPGRPVRTGGADEGIGRGADYHYGAEYEERHGGDARQEPDYFLFFFHGSGILGRSDRSVYVQLICHTEIFSNLFSPLQGLPKAFFEGDLSGKSGWESEIFSISLYR